MSPVHDFEVIRLCYILFQVMVLCLLNMRMEVGIVVEAMVEAEVVGEDVVSVAVEGVVTMDLSLIPSRMEDTIKKHLFKAEVFAHLYLLYFSVCGLCLCPSTVSIRIVVCHPSELGLIGMGLIRFHCGLELGSMVVLISC